MKLNEIDNQDVFYQALKGEPLDMNHMISFVHYVYDLYMKHINNQSPSVDDFIEFFINAYIDVFSNTTKRAWTILSQTQNIELVIAISPGIDDIEKRKNVQITCRNNMFGSFVYKFVFKLDPLLIFSKNDLS